MVVAKPNEGDDDEELNIPKETEDISIFSRKQGEMNSKLNYSDFKKDFRRGSSHAIHDEIDLKMVDNRLTRDIDNVTTRIKQMNEHNR